MKKAVTTDVIEQKIRDIQDDEQAAIEATKEMPHWKYMKSFEFYMKDSKIANEKVLKQFNDIYK